MKNSFGQNLQITLFGESHGPYIGAVLDGLAPGLEVNEDFIRSQLTLRRPVGAISTGRVEADEYTIVSGVFNGRTTGTPLCILIPNTAQRSKDYENAPRIARPGHADYAAHCKYHGFEDYRGGGHFSGRITAGPVAVGAIVIEALRKKGIFIGTHIERLHDIKDRAFIDLKADIDKLNASEFAVLDPAAGENMKKAVEEAAAVGDSTGGVLETAVIGLPAGVGEPWFDTVEGLLSHALFGIPAIKGVQFGAGFDMVNAMGSEFNDPIRNKDGKIVTTTNHNGGINGGITNGMPVIFRCAVKPTPSIYTEQKSIDINTEENADLQINGRHDPAIIHRARVVVDSITALVLYDILSGRYGTDWFCS
ncbi:MAG: chorismate synthase [Lachnospiraceae bacterium]|nr:chorismate synthase [Lachnospiraceae bacterium]